jgi:hypothetical protein
MGTPSAALRQAYGRAVPDHQAEEFLSWLADRDAMVREISGGSLLRCKDPGWVDLWDQDASVDECLEDLAGVDFEFEGLLLAHHGERA